MLYYWPIPGTIRKNALYEPYIDPAVQCYVSPNMGGLILSIAGRSEIECRSQRHLGITINLRDQADSDQDRITGLCEFN